MSNDCGEGEVRQMERREDLALKPHKKLLLDRTSNRTLCLIPFSEHATWDDPLRYNYNTLIPTPRSRLPVGIEDLRSELFPF